MSSRSEDQTGPRGDEGAREVKGSIPKTLLAYVRRSLGEDAVSRVCAEAGQRPDARGLTEAASWTSHEATVALAEAAARVCGDPEIGRRAGEELMRISYERGTVDFVRATGSVGAALEMAVNVSTKMSQGRIYEVAEVGERSATVVSWYADPAQASRFYCGYAAGYFGLLPGVFGHAGVIAEPECTARGDARCLFQLRWAETPGGSTVAPEEIADSRDRVDSIMTRFEELHHMATELAAAEDVDELLARITDRAATAVGAPRNLLAVHGIDEGELHVHHHGFDSAEQAEAMAVELLDGRLTSDERTLIAEVVSDGHVYGRLLARYPRGATVTHVEGRLLDAYARHAAAALEAVDSLQRARRDRDTAQGLLGLAETLAKVGSKSDVARRLAAAIPEVVESATAHVWLWDPPTACLRLEGRYPYRGPAPPVAALAAGDIPELDALLGDPTVMVIDPEQATEELRAILPPGARDTLVVVPIVARERLLGLLAVGARELTEAARGPLAARDDLLARVRGMTDQAATALDNAELLERVRDQSLVDALTDLPNRKLLEDRVRHAMRLGRRSSAGVALLFVDLDDFKRVNDMLGHESGDTVLLEATRRLQDCLRTSDTLARLGGDEFVVLLPEVADPEDALAVGHKIQAAFARPFLVEGQEALITCSIGVAVSPDHGADYSELLRSADSAMYQAKEDGGATCAVATDHGRPASPRQLDLESELRSAIDRDALTVVFQPQVDLRTGEIAGVEALVRWDHPVMGRLAPGSFLPIAERSGLVVALDRLVRARALEQAARWRAAGFPLRIAVNLSDRSMRQAGLAEEIGELVARVGLPPAAVELEITEHVLLDHQDLDRILAPLHELGVRIAIDDLGTGSSVLARLGQVAVHTVKIDRTLVQTIQDARGPAPVVTGVLSMADGLGLEVVAEGVESSGQLDFLARSGSCQLAQGFRLHPPMDVADLGEVLSGQGRLAPDAHHVAG